MDLSLTIGQLKSLFFIDFEGSTNFKKLATALGVTPPNVTGIVDHLVEQGLVTEGQLQAALAHQQSYSEPRAASPAS